MAINIDKFISDMSDSYPEFLRIYNEHRREYGDAYPPMTLMLGEFSRNVIDNCVEYDVKELFDKLEIYSNSGDDYTETVVLTGFVEGIVNYTQDKIDLKRRMFDLMGVKMGAHARAWDNF